MALRVMWAVRAVSSPFCIAGTRAAATAHTATMPAPGAPCTQGTHAGLTPRTHKRVCICTTSSRGHTFYERLWGANCSRVLIVAECLLRWQSSTCDYYLRQNTLLVVLDAAWPLQMSSPVKRWGPGNSWPVLK